MTEIAVRDTADVTTSQDPTGGRLVAWAQAASAANQLAKALTTTQFVPKEFAGKPGDATAAILLGDELGLSPLAALRSIYVVHGAPALYARTMVALAQAQGHDIWTEATSDQRVIVCGKRRGTQTIERSEWTIDRARKAGYTSNKKYASNPQEMLYAKAAAEVARKIAADALTGVPFSVEDLELGEPEPTATVKRTRRTARTPDPEPTVEEPGFNESPDLEPTLEPVDMITKPQLAKLQAHYAGIDRMERLADAESALGYHVDSFSALTRQAASLLIDTIESRGDTPEDAERYDAEPDPPFTEAGQ